MYEIESAIKDRKFEYKQFKEVLERAGYSLGGAWEYDHGYFDYKLGSDNGYHFLRIPFHTINGQIEDKNVMIQLDQPYILTHKYQNDVDENAESSVIQAAFNQFQTPIEKDADIPAEYIERGQQVLSQLEVILDHLNKS
ncbi:YugN-like family protein [Gracilibacillus ureilyticus]|uniref:YugN-like family protein n=1 Tax=Gracilibacillus ureilyticus TaxID=531814 RepID=A0A1H9TRF1_9BACI|nr:YugN family protein [Gracilibacillus ureilyticus]SER99765.1 YugN-like family protein [Gracilibacillus ureilyticus]